MEIHDRLRERVPDAGRLQRVVILGPGTAARHISAVLVRIPPGHECAVHTHPVAEDCFGAGVAIRGLQSGARLLRCTAR